jgi:hypothetical protein
MGSHNTARGWLALALALDGDREMKDERTGEFVWEMGDRELDTN